MMLVVILYINKIIYFIVYFINILYYIYAYKEHYYILNLFFYSIKYNLKLKLLVHTIL